MLDGRVSHFERNLETILFEGARHREPILLRATATLPQVEELNKVNVARSRKVRQMLLSHLRGESSGRPRDTRMPFVGKVLLQIEEQQQLGRRLQGEGQKRVDANQQR